MEYSTYRDDWDEVQGDYFRWHTFIFHYNGPNVYSERLVNNQYFVNVAILDFTTSSDNWIPIPEVIGGPEDYGVSNTIKTGSEITITCQCKPEQYFIKMRITFGENVLWQGIAEMPQQ